MVPIPARILIGVIAALSIATAVIMALAARDIKSAMLIIKDMKECDDDEE